MILIGLGVAMEMFDFAVERKFPGIEIEQLHTAQEIAVNQLWGRRV
jgi:hypothetical protein